MRAKVGDYREGESRLSPPDPSGGEGEPADDLFPTEHVHHLEDSRRNRSSRQGDPDRGGVCPPKFPPSLRGSCPAPGPCAPPSRATGRGPPRSLSCEGTGRGGRP